MGCCFSSEYAGEAGNVQETAPQPKREAPTRHYSKPKWKSQQPITSARLQAMRDEYWDTQPHYGGDRVIWDAIKAACEAPDMATTRVLLEAAGVIVARPDMTVMYDERGVRYVLPNYALSAPTNLVREDGNGNTQQQQQQQQQQQIIQLQPQQGRLASQDTAGGMQQQL